MYNAHCFVSPGDIDSLLMEHWGFFNIVLLCIVFSFILKMLFK